MMNISASPRKLKLQRLVKIYAFEGMKFVGFFKAENTLKCMLLYIKSQNGFPR